MKAVQMTLDEDLLARVDHAAMRMKTSRSAFTRHALLDALSRLDERAKERRHRAGYRREPVKEGEFAVPEAHRAWGDAWQDR